MTTKKRNSVYLASRLDWFTKNINSINSESWNFETADTQYLLHNLHAYPAKFIPQIPKRAILRWSKVGDTILDPFCGSGTTLLECALLGRNSIGIDNNSIASLIARAKVTRYCKDDLKELNFLIESIEHFDKSSLLINQEIKNLIPNYSNLSKWFDEKAISELAWLKNQISKITGTGKLLALTAFSSIILSSSRQDSDTRYANIHRPYQSGSAIRKWISKMRLIINQAIQNSSLIKASIHKIYTADSRTLSVIDDNSIKLIVTSPPYLNAYDYHKYHRNRLYWINGDVELARGTEVGKHDTFSRPNANPQTFFDDMITCLKEWKRVLIPKGRAFVVIGDAIVNKKFVPIGDTFVNIANDVNLELEDRWMRNIAISNKSFNMNARMKREHLLLFKKI